MKEFYCFTYGNEENKTVKTYLKDEATVLHRFAMLRESIKWAMVSRYTDQGDCYLLDLDYGKDGFLTIK